MAAKNKQTARLESEIEKCRSDANWSRAVEIAKQITSKTPGLGTHYRHSFVYRRKDSHKR